MCQGHDTGIVDHEISFNLNLQYVLHLPMSRNHDYSLFFKSLMQLFFFFFFFILFYLNFICFNSSMMTCRSYLHSMISTSFWSAVLKSPAPFRTHASHVHGGRRSTLLPIWWWHFLPYVRPSHHAACTRTGGSSPPSVPETSDHKRELGPHVSRVVFRKGRWRVGFRFSNGWERYGSSKWCRVGLTEGGGN